MLKISVIIPAYNVAPYIGQCLNSLLKQSLNDIEIICINDGSTDDTEKVINHYVELDPRICLISQKNKGVSEARNVGLKRATGEYITFVDPDDFLILTGLEQLYCHAKVTDSDIVHGLFSVCNEEGEDVRSWWHNEGYRPLLDKTPKSGEEFLPYLFKMESTACNGIYKHELIKSNEIYFPKKIIMVEDMYWTYGNHIYAKKITSIECEYYIYRLRNKSATSYKRNSNISILSAIKLVEKKFPRVKSYLQWQERKLVLVRWAIYDLIPLKILPYFMLKSITILPFKDVWMLSKNFFIEKVKGKIKKLPLIRKLYLLQTKLEFLEKELYNKEFMLDNLSHKLEEQRSIFDVKLEEQSGVFDIKFNEVTITLNKQSWFSEQNNRHVNTLVMKDYLKFNNLGSINNTMMFFQQITKWLSIAENIMGTQYNGALVNFNCYLKFLFNGILHENTFDHDSKNTDLVYLWGTMPYMQQSQAIVYAYEKRKPILIIEDGFIRSLTTWADEKALPEYRSGISFTIDDLTSYYDATRPSRLELMLNDDGLIISKEQLNRTENCIKIITEQCLSKYNHQPIIVPKIGREGVRKVLVVDQSFGDMSIVRGLADSNTFDAMLNAAKIENPDADIIIKTHPDTIAGRSGYLTHIIDEENIFVYKDEINPISLIQYVDKVYVCTTQLGFEALMCGKEVHVFGMPFYAGWGLTNDRQKCSRRIKKRTLEEIFYIAYIMYSKYVDPRKEGRCEIEDAIEYLLELRENYFNMLKKS